MGYSAQEFRSVLPAAIGMKRKGYPPEVIRAVKRCYTTLFRSKRTVEEAAAEIEAEFGDIEEVRYFLDFVRNSTRGVVR